ncbi:leucine-rich repeat neuronal protein 4 [Hippopotamus amphibius kiboko]|uniref:leucine-rich repeat neuronal protein 4 n=1 Tax=Hippopotamus amphibius kiboko TaxID=575201 RepID=UPI002591E583|nr:leucine-rich repeat neuronal protein 4 [Hippopotamus amphibius kiboko]
MWRALLLLLLLPPPPPTEPRPRRAGPLQKTAAFQLTHQGPWGSGAGNATVSPCGGLASAGVTTLTLANQSLERLPSCLPRTLRSLDGSHNLLRALSAPELGLLPRLQVLTLRHNRIAALRWGPGAPAGLHTLDLSYNLLAALPPCAGPVLPGLRALALAGNPLRALQPGAFACFPALRLLNLSCTALGRGDHAGISDSAFAGAGGAPLAALEVLDLSGTFLPRVQSGWIRDLPKLTSLYLRKMPRLRSLEGDIFKMTPDLQQLDCQDSPALTSVHTHIFQDTPRLQVLHFQNCNLSSFPPWNLHSSQGLSINLFGNPLTCSCELSWLLMDAKRIVLSRKGDTVCTPAAGSSDTFSARPLLSQLPSVCHSDQNTTLLDSNSPSSVFSTRATSTQGPSTPRSAAPSTQPAGGRQSVTKVPSLPAGSPTRASGPRHRLAEVGAAPFTTVSPASSSNSGNPPRAASTAGTEHQEHASRLVPEPDSSAASTPWANKHPGLSPAARSPASTPQLARRTPATPRAPHPPPSEGGIPMLLLDDSSEEEESGKEEAGPPAWDVPCDYHPCRHLQTPCAELQRRWRCRCPGLSGEDTLPDPPKLQAVAETTDSSALVRWCAPNSVVRAYQIRYAPEGGPGNQSVVRDVCATARQHALLGLSPATAYRVCVLAANGAGLSRRAACGAFSTGRSPALLAAGLGAAGGLLLVSTALLAAGLCRRGRAPRSPSSRTQLLAYRNPAFSNFPLLIRTLGIGLRPTQIQYDQPNLRLCLQRPYMQIRSHSHIWGLELEQYLSEAQFNPQQH